MCGGNALAVSSGGEISELHVKWHFAAEIRIDSPESLVFTTQALYCPAPAGSKRIGPVEVQSQTSQALSSLFAAVFCGV